MNSRPTNHKPSDALILVATSSSDVRARLESWRSTATRELSERPLRTLSLALAAGYLLGGGLFSRLTWRAANLALRFGLPSLLGLIEDGEASDEPEELQSTPRATKRDLGTGKRKHT
jgi:hypothetical protein